MRDRKAGDINILPTGLGERSDDEHVDDAGDGCCIRGNVDADDIDTLSVFENDGMVDEEEEAKTLAALKPLKVLHVAVGAVMEPLVDAAVAGVMGCCFLPILCELGMFKIISVN